MLRSLFSGVSGLRAHQQMMDVVGNNIANVNTTGFKGSSVVFQDLLSQILQGASATTEPRVVPTPHKSVLVLASPPSTQTLLKVPCK